MLLCKQFIPDLSSLCFHDSFKARLNNFVKEFAILLCFQKQCRRCDMNFYYVKEICLHCKFSRV